MGILDQSNNVALVSSTLPNAQALPVKQLSKLTPAETIINAVTVAAAASTSTVSFDSLGATQVFLLINSDQPWHAIGNSPWSPSGQKFLFPDVSPASQAARPSVNYPKIVLYSWNGPDGIGATTSLADAVAGALSWSTADAAYPMGCTITNDGVANATITVRVLRVWR